MTYTEIQRRRKRKYYYLVHTLRIDSGFKKIRVFLGTNLSEDQLRKKIKNKEKILREKISIIEKIEKEVFKLDIDFSKNLLYKNQLEKIEKLKRKYNKKIEFTDKDVLKKIRETFLIRYTYNTNSAEGNTISLKETELILRKGIIPESHSLREVYEIENTVRAYDYIESYKEELNHKFILKLHKLVTEKTLENKRNEGKYRLKGQNVSMSGSKHFPPKGGRQIKRLIEEIIEKYNKCKLSFIERMILFHSAFIAIHPFIDGNGRVSRLIFNWMLLRENLPSIDFPSENHIEYTDLMEISRDGDSLPLANYLFERISNSLYMSTK